MDLESVFYRKRSPQNNNEQLKESTFKPDKLFVVNKSNLSEKSLLNPSEFTTSREDSTELIMEHVVLNFGKEHLASASEDISLQRSFDKRDTEKLIHKEQNIHQHDTNEDDDFCDTPASAVLRDELRKSIHRKSIRRQSHRNMNLSDKVRV